MGGFNDKILGRRTPQYFFLDYISSNDIFIVYRENGEHPIERIIAKWWHTRVNVSETYDGLVSTLTR
jgi:hypothetical protein